MHCWLTIQNDHHGNRRISVLSWNAIAVYGPSDCSRYDVYVKKLVEKCNSKAMRSTPGKKNMFVMYIQSPSLVK